MNLMTPSRETLVDCHAHLDFAQFDDDREATVARAWDSGLVGIVNVGTSLASSLASVALAEKHPCVWASAGIHPHDASEIGPAAIRQLANMAQHPKVVAIGEIGLDYYRDLSPRPVQREGFAAQLGLASDLALPVIVHSREAHEEVLDLLSSFQGTVVLHSYSAGMRQLTRAMDAGYYISISGPVTFRNAGELREVAGAVDHERLLVETDCPYLTPEPYRGRRNEPAHVRLVAEAVARARCMALHELARATMRNAERAFGVLQWSTPLS
jgi:TatD DNase family protein